MSSACFCDLAGRPVGTVGCDRVEGVGHRDDPSSKRDRRPGKSVRVAGAVDPLVVMANHRGDLGVSDHREHLRSARGVLLDRREFGLGERARAVEDRSRRVDLAHVVNLRGGSDHRDFPLGQAHRAADTDRVAGDPLAVSVDVAVACFQQPAQAEQQLDIDPRSGSSGRFEQLAGLRQASLAPVTPHPAPQHEIGEHDVAGARLTLPQRSSRHREDQ